MIDISMGEGKTIEVERSVSHAKREGFRISELQISTSQKIPWHYHNNISDTFYVLEGEITIYLCDPKESIRLCQSETFQAKAKRPHLVTNTGSASATFLVLQGVGEYDNVPLVK